jgi:hydrogenase nickel incorporation protein HypA/HybF
MHELSITQNIVDICSDEAEKHNVKKVTEIRIKIGELSGMVPECIQTYFDIVSAGSRVEGAKLKIEKIPIKVLCKVCGFEGTIYSMSKSCSVCGSEDIKITGGNEFYIDSLEVEDGD